MSTQVFTMSFAHIPMLNSWGPMETRGNFASKVCQLLHVCFLSTGLPAVLCAVLWLLWQGQENRQRRVPVTPRLLSGWDGGLCLQFHHRFKKVITSSFLNHVLKVWYFECGKRPGHSHCFQFSESSGFLRASSTMSLLRGCDVWIGFDVWCLSLWSFVHHHH